MKIKNPIFKGFNPDPSICRKGNDYYCAVSSFEWFPGIPIYHSRDLKNWELLTNALTKTSQIDLRKLASAKGIWAPSLTYCEADDMFYLLYGCMNSTNARFYDCNNYLIRAKSVEGPWSDPIYVHSAGFDASLFHDDDGRKYICSLEWETRAGYEKPGQICLCELDGSFKPVGFPKRIWNGATDRGKLEAPVITKHNGFYYLMCAEGGTGYGHCVTLARSKDIFGEYEADPLNPIITSAPENFNMRDDPVHDTSKFFNPDSVLQKSGHGSYVNLPNGEVYLVHLTGRPFVPELRCTLGRETAIQKMEWTADGWLRKYGGGNLADEYVDAPELPEVILPQAPRFDDFNEDEPGLHFYAPRVLPETFVDLTARPGYIRLRGQEFLCSDNEVSILARKLTGVYGQVTTKLDFSPEVYQHSAGLILYYDNMNFLYLRKYFSETLGAPAISVFRIENGVVDEHTDTRIAAPDGEIYFRFELSGREIHCGWSTDGKDFRAIGGAFDLTKYSDEYSKYGRFTGTSIGIACQDALYHSKTADFDFFDYGVDEETRPPIL